MVNDITQFWLIPIKMDQWSLKIVAPGESDSLVIFRHDPDVVFDDSQLQVFPSLPSFLRALLEDLRAALRSPEVLGVRIDQLLFDQFLKIMKENC